MLLLLRSASNGPVTAVDNGDGTWAITGPGVIDLGNGVWQIDGTNVVNNGDGTATITTVTTGNIKVWNGSTWDIKPVKCWDGTAWVAKLAKTWTGTGWVVTNY